MERKRSMGAGKEMLHGLFRKIGFSLLGLAGICLIFLSDILFQAGKFRDAARQSTQQAERSDGRSGIGDPPDRNAGERAGRRQSAGDDHTEAPEKRCMHATNNHF